MGSSKSQQAWIWIADAWVPRELCQAWFNQKSWLFSFPNFDGTGVWKGVGWGCEVQVETKVWMSQWGDDGLASRTHRILRGTLSVQPQSWAPTTRHIWSGGIENPLPLISVKRLDHHYHCSNPGEKLPPHGCLLFASVNQLSSKTQVQFYP